MKLGFFFERFSTLKATMFFYYKNKKSYVNVNVVGEKKIIFADNPKAVGETK